MFHFNNHLSSIQHDNYTTLLKDTRMLLEAQQHWITFMKCSWSVATNYLSISTVCQEVQLKINCGITRLHLMVPSFLKLLQMKQILSNIASRGVYFTLHIVFWHLTTR